MPVKVLKNEGRELRLRIIGETFTTLQMFRSRLNEMDDVEYANFFQNHPDLDDPELYVRAAKGKKAAKKYAKKLKKKGKKKGKRSKKKKSKRRGY